MKYVLIMLLLLSSCLENKPGTNILTPGIFNQAIFSINKKNASGQVLQLGEHLLTDPSKILEVEVYNGTKYAYTQLKISFSADNDQATSINYVPSEEGELGFPGAGGDCTQVLLPGKSCKIFLELAPREERTYTEFIKLSYHNYVDIEEHSATLQLLAGMPASLVFTNDQTQYIFGTPAGPAATPVVERADAEVLDQTIEIKNVGGLSATHLLLESLPTCTSIITLTCPSGMDGAYKLAHNCPTSLSPGATCQATITYQPKNQNPSSGPIPDEIKEINYRLVVTARYQTDSSGRSAALNAYFNSISTDIQAKLITTNIAVNYIDPIISGNRDMKQITIRNAGYRSGFLNSLSFYNQSNSLMATCHSEGEEFLTCNKTDNNPILLSELPFKIKDKHNCVSQAENPVEIVVGQGCIFEIIFQPSTTFTTDKSTEFEGLFLFSTYDALWKGQSTIITSRLSTINAKSLAPAQMAVERIRYSGADYYTLAQGLPAKADLGRLALQSPQYARYQNLIITFKNMGSVAANAISFKDGLNRAISVGGSGNNIGAKAPYFYRSAVASDTTCTIIEPGGQCSLSMLFAPIGMDSIAEEDANMFDGIDEALQKIKIFNIQYDSGARFSDSNFSLSPDYPQQVTAASMTANLVRKGLLLPPQEDPRNKLIFGKQAISQRNEAYSYLYLRNIGTGPISYIQNLAPPSALTSSPNYTWSLVPTDPSLIDSSKTDPMGAQYDCLSLVDTNLTSDTTITPPGSRPVSVYQALPKDESCVYTVRFRPTERNLTINPHECNNQRNDTQISTTEEATRLFYLNGGENLWTDCIVRNSQKLDVTFRYFDGDTSDPNRVDSSFGNSFLTDKLTLELQQSIDRKITPYNINPFITASVYRPAFTLPALSTGLSQHNNAVNFAEQFFYGLGTKYFRRFQDVNNTSQFVKGDYARHVLPLLSTWQSKKNEYDYIYYLGTFPKGMGDLVMTPGLLNSSFMSMQILSLNHGTIPGANNGLRPTTPTSLGLYPKTVNSGGAISPLQLTLDTSSQGEQAYEMKFNIETGELNGSPQFFQSSDITNPGELSQKTRTASYLFLANILDTPDHPKLAVSIADYDVSPNDGAPPTVTLGTASPIELSWFNQAEKTTTVFDSIKLTSIGPNDSFAKKRIYIKNDSTHAINGFSYFLRLSTLSDISTIITENLTVIAGESTCVNNSSLAPNASCYLTYKYQPLSAEVSKEYTLSFLYRSTRNEYFAENLKISLMPRAPGELIAVGKAKQVINYKSTPTSSTVTRNSFNLPFSTTALTAIPTNINFTQETGTMSKIELENLQATKSSLLLAYQRYLTLNNLRGYSAGNPAGSSVVPDTYQVRADGLDYAPIYLKKHADNLSNRLSVEASRSCFYGDDEFDASIPLHEKGFNNDTTSSCYLRITLAANFDYLNKEIKNNNAEDMMNNAFELNYYSVKRTSSASIWLHLTGKINPVNSSVVGSYSKVNALDNRTVNFVTPNFNPTSPALGIITGVRVYYSDSANSLTNIYNLAPDKYIDIRTNTDGQWTANITSNLANGQYFYFMATAIRYDARFKYTTERFPGLQPGEYVSLGSGLASLKVMVPPTNHYYVHDQKKLVEKTINGGVTALTYAVAAKKCTDRSLNMKNPSTFNKKYLLMDFNLWQAIKGIPTAHGYANHLGVAHWLNDPLVSIPTILGGYPEYISTSDSQMLESYKYFYYRSPTNRSNPVRISVGGIPSTGVQDYTALVAPEILFGNARCMIQLD